MSLQFSNKLDWRPHLTRIVILLVASLYLVIAAYVRFDQKTAMKRASMQTQQQQVINRASEASQDTFVEYYPQYTLLVGKGRIGEANRLNWIETLRTVAEEIGIPDIHFHLDNTRIAEEGETPFFHYEIPVYITDMYLNLKLLHEGDLYNLFKSYEVLAKGTYSVQACEIRKIGGTGKAQLYEGLQAKCHLRWFNLHDLQDAWEENLDEV